MTRNANRRNPYTVIARVLKRILPERSYIALRTQFQAVMGMRWAVWFRLLRAYWHDLKQYGTYSGTISVASKDNHEARMTMDYHRIEKGLSLKRPRPGFGRETVQRLLQDVDSYSSRYGMDHVVEASLGALEAYFDFNVKHGVDVRQLELAFVQLRTKLSPERNSDGPAIGGITKLTRARIVEASNIDFQAFSESRRSIRNFVPGSVPLSDIEKAISLAQTTPSVCNRQMWKVHVFLDEHKKQSILRYQNGNRGFGEDAGAILVITTSLAHFIGIGERNQAYIDGGMYAMNLLYAFHSLGYGTCALNLSLTPLTAKALREAANIPHSEALIMMVAVGNLPDELAVAASPRKAVERVVVVH